MRKKVLLVDDSNTALMMERMLLHQLPYEVVTARDGAEAVAKAIAERPDLILMDVIMPHMNGFEACRKLKSTETTKGIPIIMVTTRGEQDNIERGFESGCNDYITKPIDGLDLITKLRNFLGE